MGYWKNVELILGNYRGVEKELSTEDRNIRLVGQARSARPCTQCRKVIATGEYSINYGKVGDR
jgi:hypothetical protein